jgi:hypothetical protein
VTGEIALSKARHANWKALTADPNAYSDWPKPKAMGEPATVATLLRDLEKSKRFGSLLELATSARHIRVRARFTSETDHRCQTLMLALRTAASLGAKGKVTIVSAREPPMEPPLQGGVWLLELDGKSSRYRELVGPAKRKVNADPQVFALVTSFDDDSPIPERMARGNARRAAAVERRASLSIPRAASTLVKRVAKPLTTGAAVAAAEQLMAKIGKEPDAADTLWKVWRILCARAPRLGTRAYRLDPERSFRLLVGKALIRAELPLVSDKKLRAMLVAATRKEWPDPKQLSQAVDALAGARKS